MSTFHLSKFPVTTEHSTYRVDVGLRRRHYEDVMGGCEDYDELYVKVYVKHKLFRPRVFYAAYTYPDKIEQWKNRYVELAIMRVHEVEEILQEERDEQSMHQRGIDEWNAWDGDARDT